MPLFFVLMRKTFMHFFSPRYILKLGLIYLQYECRNYWLSKFLYLMHWFSFLFFSFAHGKEHGTRGLEPDNLYWNPCSTTYKLYHTEMLFSSPGLSFFIMHLTFKHWWSLNDRHPGGWEQTHIVGVSWTLAVIIIIMLTSFNYQEGIIPYL